VALVTSPADWELEQLGERSDAVLVVDLLRSDVARRSREEAMAASSDRQRPSDDAAFLANVAEADAWQLLQPLTQLERQSISLAYFGGNSYREVATMLQLPVGTVKSRIRSGLGRLRATIQPA